MATRSPLPLLIRRADMEVDERRSELAALVEQESIAADRLRAHDVLRDAEHADLPNRPPELLTGFAHWVRHHANERAKLQDRVDKLRRTREAAELTLQQACAALKSLELADEARRAAEKREAARRQEAKVEDAELIRRAADQG